MEAGRQFVPVLAALIGLWIAETAIIAAEPTSPPLALHKAMELTDARVLQIAQTLALTSDVVRLGLEYAFRYKPQFTADFDDLLKTKPQRLRSQLSDLAAWSRQLAAIKDPPTRAHREEYLQTEAEAERLAMRCKSAAAADKPAIESQMKTAIRRLFDFRAGDERNQIEQAKKNIAQREAALDQQMREKDRTIQSELARLLGLGQSFAW